MSQQRAEPVRGFRIPLVPSTRRHRTLDEWIIVRFPRLNRLFSAAWARMPRDSRLRRAVLVRRVRQGYAAFNRRDFDLLINGFDPAIELHTAHVFPDAGAVFHGHDGYREFWRQWLGGLNARLDLEELIDFGDSVLVTAKMIGQGEGSGVSVSQPIFQLVTFRRGLVVREDDFQDRAEALEAVGLSEEDAHADS